MDTTAVSLEAGWNLVGPAQNCGVPAGIAEVWTWGEDYQDALADPEFPGLIQGRAYWMFVLEHMDVELPPTEGGR